MLLFIVFFFNGGKPWAADDVSSSERQAETDRYGEKDRKGSRQTEPLSVVLFVDGEPGRLPAFRQVRDRQRRTDMGRKTERWTDRQNHLLLLSSSAVNQGGCWRFIHWEPV